MSFEPKKMGHQLQLVITLPSESENEKNQVFCSTTEGNVQYNAHLQT